MKVVRDDTLNGLPPKYREKVKDLCDDLQFLISVAQRHDYPETLCLFPKLNPEQHTFGDTEVGVITCYHNALKLLRLPTAGAVDAKVSYSSVYAGKTMKTFFGGKHPDLFSLRVVIELVLLYNLSADDLELMTKSPCSFIPTEKDVPANEEKLKAIYSKKEVARQLQAIYDKKRDVSLPLRLLKGMEYPSYADALHVFRAFGANPYEGVVALATQNTEWLDTCRKKPSDQTAFATRPVYFLVDMAPTSTEHADFAYTPKSSTVNKPVIMNVPAEAPSVTETHAPVTPAEMPTIKEETSKEVKDMSNSIPKISLKLRLCQPCDFYSWENDNPNKDEPGFHWKNAPEKTIAACIDTLSKEPFTPESIRSAISSIVEVPFKAQVTCMGKDFRATIDLF